MKFIAFLVLLCTIGCSSWRGLHRWRTASDEPRIRAFVPEGLRVTLDSTRGPSSIKFVGTIYRDSKNIHVEGDFSLDTARHRNRKWVFYDKQVMLKVGDILNYEIYEGRSGYSYKTYDGNAEIYELLDMEKCRTRFCPPSNVPPSTGDESPQKGAASVPTTEKPITVDPVNVNLLELKLKSCQQSVINTTNVLLELQSQILRLETKNELLSNILSKSPNARRITITGVIPQEGSAVETANFIVWEKLDIKPHIVSANRINATAITFEVETIEEKLDIIEEAEDRLASGRIVVS